MPKIKGCKLVINIASDEVKALGKDSKVKLELLGFDTGSEAATATSQYHKIGDLTGASTKNEFTWTYYLEATSSSGADLGGVEIDYGQRWLLDGDRTRDASTDVSDDKEAPKRGFRVDNSFDGVTLDLTSRGWDGPAINLGKHDKGKFNVTPTIPLRATIIGARVTDSYEFSFNPKDPTTSETHYTQTINFHPAKWSSG